jgi:hypothetical protein
MLSVPGDMPIISCPNAIIQLFLAARIHSHDVSLIRCVCSIVLSLCSMGAVLQTHGVLVSVKMAATSS